LNNGKLTIVMYHYIRDIRNSAYPRLKGLDIASFKRQLDFLQSSYTMVRLADLRACIQESKPLPVKACWLTFDDGYRDHYEYVFPELLSRGIEGAFFPPSKPITDREILDANKIHFILARVKNVEAIVADLKAAFFAHDLVDVMGKSFEALWSELAKPNRFDSGDVIFVKRLLQHALPPRWRERLADVLFKKYVSTDAHAFADDLYMSSAQLSEMIKSGMYVGSHGYRHLWLGKETYATQLDEIQKSLEFLDSLGAPTRDWVMCYPYGNHDAETLDILKSKGCLLGLTTNVGVADLQVNAPLELPRLDTNDLPQ
jgi:peptidoglycan/xylan/chitin deacetylase (PgdA/CDA1 family)